MKNLFTTLAIGCAVLLTGCGSDSGVKLILDGSATIPRDPCVKFKASLLDGANNPVAVGAAGKITLAGNGTGSFFKSFSDCKHNLATNEIDVLATDTTKDVWFKDYTAEALSLSATVNGTTGKLDVAVTAQPFTKAIGLNSNGYRMTADSKGRIIVSGNFTTFDTTSVPHLARFNYDGTVENISQGTGLNAQAFCLFLTSDDQIYMAGGFSSYNGTTANVLRLDTAGAVDTAFATGTGFNNNCSGATTIPGSTDTLWGGYMTQYKGVASGALVRLDATGNKVAFVPGVGVTSARGVPPTVANIFPTAGGSFIILGDFQHYDTTAIKGVAKVDAMGALATYTQGTGLSAASQPYVYINAIDEQERVYVYGFFDHYGTTAITGNVMRIKADGTYDSSFVTGTGFDSSLANWVPLDDGTGRVYVAGYFSHYNGTAVKEIIRLNQDGTLDSTFNIGTGFDSSLDNIMLAPDGSGDLYVIGSFTHFNGQPATHMARLTRDGALY